jgi:hypothetical protein
MLRASLCPVNPYRTRRISNLIRFGKRCYACLALATNQHRVYLKMARPERFELPTTKFVAWYSIQLSYGRVVKPYCCRLDRDAEGAEARSGIIQVLAAAVNTLCEVF